MRKHRFKFPAARGFAVVVMFSLTLRADQIVYDDALENGWQNWGWANLNYANTSPVHSGSDSISVTISGAWQGIQIWHSDQDSTPYSTINVWLNGGANGGQRLQVYGLLDANGSQNYATSPRVTLSPLPANGWHLYSIPLSQLDASDVPNFTGFVIQDGLGQAQPTFYVDDISLVSATNTVAGG